MAHLLTNDPLYLGRTMPNVASGNDFQAAIKVAREDVTKALEAACGKTIQECAQEDIGRFNNPSANEAFYADTQPYDLPVVYPKTADTIEDVGKIDKDAGYLLTAAFP